VPFDLSNVMFITTANTLDTIPGPLRDRMEVIQLAGYTEDEKLQIAKRYLVPRQIERNGLKKSWISISDRRCGDHRDYTREAGVRGSSARSARCAARSRAVAEWTLETRKYNRECGRPWRAARRRRFFLEAQAALEASRAWRRAGVDPGGRRRSCSSWRPRCLGRGS
jgi:ATP-dependent Lon protease